MAELDQAGLCWCALSAGRLGWWTGGLTISLGSHSQTVSVSVSLLALHISNSPALPAGE